MRKQILSILLCLVMVVGLFPTMAFAADGSGATTGSGTKSDPYCVSTYDEMKRLLQTRASYYIKVVGMDNDVTVEGVPARLLKVGRDFESAKPAIDIPYGANHHLEIATDIWFIPRVESEDDYIFSNLIDVESKSSLEITGTGSIRVDFDTPLTVNSIIYNWGGELTIDGSVTLNGIQCIYSNISTRPIGISGGVTNIKGGYIYGYNDMSDEVTSAIYFSNNLATGTALNISGGTIKQVNNITNHQGNENSCALYVDDDNVANAIHLTGGTFEGGMKMANGKPLSNLLAAGYQFYDMSANTVLDGSVSKTQKKLIVTPTGVDNPTVIDNASLTVKSLNERKTLSDLACSYSPNNKMVLDNFFVYKGLNNTSDTIKDKDTLYNSNQSYTVMYVFKANEGFVFSSDIENNVTVTGGDFWMADTFGGSTNTLRVFVNFPGDTAIDSVALNVPELKVGDTSGDFTLSGTNTGVSAVTTEWRDIPATGAVESTSYRALVTLKAEDGYVFDTNTNVTLIGDYWGSSTGITSDGKTMTVLVSVRILHKHTFSGEWQIASTGNVHFREYSCGAQEKEPHTWKYNDATGKYKCTKCNYEIDGGKDSITSVLAYLRSPIAGEHPGDYTAAEWVEIGGANYKVEHIVWKNMDDTDVTTFESGEIYKGTVTFKADTGFAFDGDRIYSDKIFASSNAEVVGDYTLADGGTTLTATFKLKDNTVVRPGLQVKVKLPTLNDKIGKSLPVAELVGTTLPENVTFTYNVYENDISTEVTDPDYKVKPNQKYFYLVWLKLGESTDITEITKKYNVSYTVTDGGDAETCTDFLGHGVLAMYQTPDAAATSKISSVALTVTAPKYGEAPATSATGANNTLYTVGKPEWSPAVTDGKFGAGAYTVSIPVTAAEGYSFDANCLYTVNGYVATYADGKVSYTFPALTAPHEHSYGTDWKYDDTNHWHECECGDKADIAAHSASEWIIDTAATETADGTKHKECTVCKKVLETATIPATHTHS
ncbi:hypothetical protein [Youxingia wuxianensis]|uniref:MBG domain-containing protein n=1 Tax=Youxingia wuxianensis TaxID=2763678 RepID=A0A926IHZ1_9FIRM|nr:hypothetical protein [Youxingia wuxianensis]MBC8585811.1 hypothetical protein [Youxingia wuxianensis]